MKKRFGCEYETKIVQSIKSGTTNENISAHLQTCSDCRETAKISRLLQTGSIARSAPKNLPAAGFIWWKSEMRAKKQRAVRAAQPIFVVQCIAAAVFSATVIWLIFNPQFSFLDAAFDRLIESFEQIFVYLTAGLIVLALTCTTLILFLRRFLLEK